MKRTFFKRLTTVTLIVVMLISCVLALTGCGKQETTTQEDTNETLAGTVWTADYFVTDSFGKLTLEESIEQGFLESDTNYVLEFVDENISYLRMLHGETVSSEDPLPYTFQSANLKFTDSSITEANYNSSDGITIKHLAGGEETTFHFVRSDTATQKATTPTEKETPDTLPETSVGPDDPEESTAATSGIEWLDFYNETTTGNGYELNEHLHISKWISADDTATIEAAWAEVGKGHEFPSETQLGYGTHGSGTYSTVDGFGRLDYDDMYYAIGYLEVTNETEGFDIDSSNTLTYNLGLTMLTKFEPCHLLLSYSDSNHVYYCHYGSMLDGTRNSIYFTMKSNHWGTIPIVLALPVDRTPNYPDGNPSPSDATFMFGSTEFTLE